MAEDAKRPLVVITGAGGNLGAAIADGLSDAYRVVGLDLDPQDKPFPILKADLTNAGAIRDVLAEVRRTHGGRIASVIHLAAYFDFTGEDHPLYEKLNVEGARHFLRALQDFEVEQFIYSGTMLVHAPGKLGHTIDESQPIAPKWAYPKSKAAAEEVIRAEQGDIPTVLLHLAGVYDEKTAVPTLSHQIARIYERDLKSHLYSGDPDVGQAMLHKADMVAAFRAAVDRRADLPSQTTILVGEPDTLGYDQIQDIVGKLIHGEDDWATLQAPKPIAKAGAWLEDKLEPMIPDAIDQGEKPFIRPFMVDMADDHYALDIRRARDLLGWTPKHRLRETLPRMVDALRADPAGWYADNGLTPAPWIAEAEDAHIHPEVLRTRHDRSFRNAHRASRWAHLVNVALGIWLITQPPLIGLGGPWLIASEMICGALLIVFALLSLSARLWIFRWASAAVGFWVLCAPFVFWTPNAAAYLSDTLLGGLIIAFAVGVRPEPGVSPVAAVKGPLTPPGWSYNPSDWTQRIPIIALALVGVVISRYLAAYQLEQVDGVWDPFFAGGPDPKNGTEEIITSSVSKAWPVPDAAVGAMTYMLEVVTGIIGARARWRTMPWLVLIFGLMIAPLGIVSITFIVIQPIVLGTWCALCLVAAAAMLIQIPYSLDELLATCQFLWRRKRAGKSLLRALVLGDTDEGRDERPADEFDRPAGQIVRDMVAGGVNLPWNLWLIVGIGTWLMFTRLTIGASGNMANADHLVGALVITTVAVAAAEVARSARFLVIPLGLALIAMPFMYGTDSAGWTSNLVCGLAMIGLCLRRGPIRARYGGWSTVIK